MSEQRVETAEEQLARWNPPATDHALERLVGQPTEPADTRATAHVPVEGLIENSPTSSKVDAGLGQYADDADTGLPPVPQDEDGNPDYDELKNAELKAHLEARGLPTSGRHDDLVSRLEEDDESGDDEDDDDE